MLAPVLALFAYVRVYPIAWSVVLSFYRLGHDPRRASPSSASTTTSPCSATRTSCSRLKNTAVYSFATVALSTLLALPLAVFLANRGRLSAFYQTVYFLPVITPMVPMAIAWKWIYDYNYGILNYILVLAGIPAIAWLTDPDIALWALVIMGVWKMLGYNLILFLVGIRNIPATIMEAASLDGVSEWQRFWFVTLPLLKPILLYVVVTATINAFNVFTQVYVMTLGSQAAPGQAVRVLVFDIYQNGFQYFHMGYASAEAVMLTLFVLGFTMIQFRFMRSQGDVDAPQIAAGASRLGTLAVHAVLMLGAALMVLPMLWMLATSLKSSAEIADLAAASAAADRPPWPTSAASSRRPVRPLLRQQRRHLARRNPQRRRDPRLAGAVFAKYRFPGRGVLFGLIIATAIVPFESYMIPLYLQLNAIKWINTYQGIVLPYLFMSFGIFLMRQHVASAIPDRLSRGRAHRWRVGVVDPPPGIAPLSTTALSAIGIFAFIQAWAAFIWPLLVANDQLLFNMEVGLTAFQFKFSADYGKLMAGSVVSVVPMLVVFLILRRRIIESVALTGLKG